MRAMDIIFTVIISVSFSIAIIFLISCETFVKKEDVTEDGVKWFEYIDMNVIRHRETGVCYYVTEDYITPLYNADGSLYTLGD